jgi:hypothetical protein
MDLTDSWYNSLIGGSAHSKASTDPGQHKHKIREHTTMYRVGFEASIPVFDTVETGSSLDHATSVISSSSSVR